MIASDEFEVVSTPRGQNTKRILSHHPTAVLTYRRAAAITARTPALPAYMPLSAEAAPMAEVWEGAAPVVVGGRPAEPVPAGAVGPAVVLLVP
jgi:hypothetical protein